MRLLPIVLITLLISTSAMAIRVAPPNMSPPTVAAPLPADVQPILTQYQAAYDALRAAHDKQLGELRTQTIAKLRPLQEQYTKSGKLEEAIAIRNKIQELGGLQTLTSWHQPAEQEIGQRFTVEIIGLTAGSVWGTGPYTADSNPGAAAVHAGLLKPGEKALLEFEVVPGFSSWPGSVSNGVTSQAYGPWPVGYRITKPAK